MGKRKIHGQTYFQCDWTGLPMRATNCYMPTWNESGKLLKHGSYCCWEAVVAHAMECMAEATHGSVTGDALTILAKIREHINGLVGCVVHPAPHWSELAWFARDATNVIETPQAFLRECQNAEDPVIAVRMQVDGTTHEVMCSQDEGDKFSAHLTKPFNSKMTPQSFQTVRKKGSKDRDLTVFYYPDKNGLPFNQSASHIFKMQIYGDVLLVQQSKEPCFLPRERYVNYFHTDFTEQFANKHKRKDHTPTLTSADYAAAKREMASELRAVEELCSSSSSLPGELARGAAIPPPCGREIAALAELQCHVRPQKRLRPTPVAELVEVGA